MADGVYLSAGDAKNRVTFGTNPITRTIDVGSRIMITNKTLYRITNLTDFEYNDRIGENGLISCLALQTEGVAEDDYVNNIAYNRDNGECNNSKIKGLSEIYLYSENEYSIEYDKEIEFVLDFNYVNTAIISQENNSCIVKHNDSMDDLGTNVMLIARDKESKETIDMLNILVRGV